MSHRDENKAAWDRLARGRSQFARVVTDEELLRPLQPTLIYFYQTDVAGALRRTAAERGEEFVALLTFVQSFATGPIRWQLTRPPPSARN